MSMFDKLLRKSVRRNTWIFVADTSFRLYVGIKASGAFQHSSFLRGARISAAGLIKVRSRRPFDFTEKFVLAGGIRGTYNDQNKKYDPLGNVLVSARGDTPLGEVGVLLNLDE